MKKLLIFVLTAMMVLSMTAVAMASAVTFSGFARYGYDWVAVPAAGAAGASDGKYKLSTNIAISDSLSANITFVDSVLNSSSNPQTDAAYFLYKTGNASIKVGSFDYNVKDSVDILNGIFGGNDLDNIKDTVLVTYNFTPKVFASLYVSQANSNTLAAAASNGYYGVSAGYAGDVFGADVYYLESANRNYIYDPVTAVNVYVKSASGFKAFVHYGTTTFNQSGTDVDYASQIIGFTYDPATLPIFARFEYDLNKGLADNADGNNMGFRVGYKFGNGLVAQYDRQIAGDAAKYTTFDGTANTNFVNVSRLRLIANF